MVNINSLERDVLRQAELCPRHTMKIEDMDMDTMITNYNTAVTDAASEILGKERCRKKPWFTKDVLDLCDERRDLKKTRYEAEGAKEYREANRRVQIGWLVVLGLTALPLRQYFSLYRAVSQREGERGE